MLTQDQLKELALILEEDVSKAEAKMLATDDSYNRRVYVRVLFAYIEGVIWAIRQQAGLMDIKQNAKTVSQAEADYADMKASSKDAIKSAFRLYATAGQAHHQLDLMGTGWDCLLKAIKIRDRVTHPKNAENLSITDQEKQTIMAAATWFKGSVDAAIIAQYEKLWQIFNPSQYEPEDVAEEFEEFVDFVDWVATKQNLSRFGIVEAMQNMQMAETVTESSD